LPTAQILRNPPAARSDIAVPIVVGEDRFGMLTLDAPEANSFTDTDLRLSQFVAELLGIAFACAKYD